MSTPTVLPASALAQHTPPPPPQIRHALMRAGLLLAPVPLAVTALNQVAEPVWLFPAVVAAAGWTALCGLTYLGQVTARRAGPAAAARLVLLGFAALAAAWSAGLAIPPEHLLGIDRGSAYLLSLPALAVCAALTLGLATGNERRLLAWHLPALGIAGAVAADRVPPEWIGPLLLTAAIAPLLTALPLARSYRHRPAQGMVLDVADLGRGASYLVLGLGQATLVLLLVWRAGNGPLSPVLLPLLIMVPASELWLAWHLTRWLRGFTDQDWPAYQRRVRALAWRSLAALLAPLAAGAALTAAAAHLPYQLSHHPDASGLVLALATGLLLVGMIAASRLLAARHRPGLAAVVVAGAVVALLVVAIPTGPAQLLWAVEPPAHAPAVTLLIWYAIMITLVATVLFDPEAHPGESPRAAWPWGMS